MAGRSERGEGDALPVPRPMRAVRRTAIHHAGHPREWCYRGGGAGDTPHLLVLHKAELFLCCISEPVPLTDHKYYLTVFLSFSFPQQSSASVLFFLDFQSLRKFQLLGAFYIFFCIVFVCFSIVLLASPDIICYRSPLF